MDQQSTQTFTGFTTPTMQKKLNDDDDKQSNSIGGLKFDISDEDEDIEIDTQEVQEEDTSLYDLDSKDPLDVPAFMRKKKK